MKKHYFNLIFGCFLTTLLFYSCHDIENVVVEDVIIEKRYEESTLSALPQYPSFAKELGEGTETREFSLRMADNTVLHFDLKSNSSTIFGKKRVLVGVVSNKKSNIKSIACMMIGDNGFELAYLSNDQYFRIRGNENLDVGYINPLSKLADLNDDQIDQLVGRLKKRKRLSPQQIGDIEHKVLQATGRLMAEEDEDKKFEHVVEQGPHYRLVNNTLASEKRLSIESGAPQPCKVEEAKSRKNLRSRATHGIYNIMIAYMPDSFDFTIPWTYLLISLNTLDGNGGFELPMRLPNFIDYTPILS